MSYEGSHDPTLQRLFQSRCPALGNPARKGPVYRGFMADTLIVVDGRDSVRSMGVANGWIVLTCSQRHSCWRAGF